MAQSLIPSLRESARHVVVVQLDTRGLMVPMSISSIGSPLRPSSLWESISRCSTIVSPTDAVVYWRLLVAFLADPDGDEQVSIIGHGDYLYNVKPADHAVEVDKQPTGPARRAPNHLSEKRRFRKGLKLAERKAKEKARAAAESVATGEANAVLERQSARPDATSAMLTSVLTKRGGTASPEVVARTRRDSLKAIERDARKPAKAKREEPNSAGQVRISGDLTNDRFDAALLLQRHVRAWLRCRKKARRRQRSRAAKRIQSSVRTWLLTRRARVTGVGECKAEPARSDPAEPPPPAVGEGGDASCVVCLERPRAVVLLPCRHLSMCALCAAGVSTCPMCRSAVEESMVVFV